MNFFARAWRYITRRKTKSILLMITFFVIGNLVIIGLGISSAAENAKILTRKQMRAVVTYEVDYDAYYNWINSLTDEDEINEAYKHYPSIEESVAKEIAEDKRIKAYNYMLSNMLYSSGFENVPVGNEESKGNSGGVMIDEAGNEMAYVEPNVNLVSINGAEMLEVAEGTFTVTEGRMPNESDNDSAAKVCAITTELAELNNLKVGDSIRIGMSQPNFIQQMKQEMPDINEDDYYLELEIVGIYKNANQVDPNAANFEWMSPYENPQNIVVTTIGAYKECWGNFYRSQIKYYQMMYPGEETTEEDIQQIIEDSGKPSRVVFLLEDPLEVDSFVEDYNSKLTDYTKLNANNETFKKLARPLDTLSFFANIIVWIVVVNAVIIISLVTALTLKTREYEIGVLLSVGVSKVKIVLQLFMELIIIAMLGFTLAAVSGSLVAGKVGSAVLDFQQETEAQYADDSTDYGYYWSSDQDYFTEVSQEDLLSQYEVKISPALIGEIYLLGAGVVLVAIVVPSLMIMRLNPKQILLEQN